MFCIQGATYLAFEHMALECWHIIVPVSKYVGSVHHGAAMVGHGRARLKGRSEIAASSSATESPDFAFPAATPRRERQTPDAVHYKA